MKIPSEVLLVMTLLERRGYEAYVVGGCVRDYLLGIVPHDWDVCTSARPEDTLRCFDGYRVVTAGMRHGTVGVVLQGQPIEITTYRKDGEYSDHRRPDAVRFVEAIEEDLSRRDFTVNAMAMHPGKGIVDPFGGREDLKRGVIRCVGDPEARIEEDALRILRALRFAVRLNFEIEPETARVLHQKRKYLKDLAAERVYNEICGFLKGRFMHRALPDFADVLQVALPGLDAEASAAVCRAKPDILERLALLLKSCGADAARMALLAVRAENRVADEVLALVRASDLELSDNEIVLKRYLNQLSPRGVFRLIDMRRARCPEDTPLMDACDLAVAHILETGQCFELRTLAVNGRDLQAQGLSGKRVGETLRALLDAVIEEALPNERAALLAAAGR